MNYVLLRTGDHELEVDHEYYRLKNNELEGITQSPYDYLSPLQNRRPITRNALSKYICTIFLPLITDRILYNK